MNSFKARKAIFGSPLSLPGPETFSLIGYESVLAKADFGLYFMNSLIVTVGSVFFVLLLGAMCAWALTEYRFKGNVLLGLFMAIGIMVPIRLGSVSILRMMVDFNLVNTLTALSWSTPRWGCRWRSSSSANSSSRSRASCATRRAATG